MAPERMFGSTQKKEFDLSQDPSKMPWEDLARSGHLAMREATEVDRERERAIDEELDREDALEDERVARERAARQARARAVMKVAEDLIRSPTGSIASGEDEDDDADDDAPPRDGGLLLAQRTESEEEEAEEEEEDDEIEIADAMKSECRKAYLAANSSQQVLIAMSIGLVDPVTKRKLGDFLVDPVYTTMSNKAAFHPVVSVLKAEMKRRAKARGFQKFKKASALRPQCIQWLEDNPVIDVHDIAWIREEEGTTYAAIKDLLEEKQREEADKQTRANWTTHEPWLRLYHCMVHDEAKEALANLDRVMQRDELDARNSDERPKTYYEVVTQLYNDEDIVFRSMVLPDLHPSFTEEIVLRFSDMPGGEISVVECQKKIGDAKGKTTQASVFIVALKLTSSSSPVTTGSSSRSHPVH